MANTLTVWSPEELRAFGKSHFVTYPLGTFPWLKDEHYPMRCSCVIGTHPGVISTTLTAKQLDARRSA